MRQISIADLQSTGRNRQAYPLKLKVLYYGALILAVSVMILMKDRYISLTFLFIVLSTLFTVLDMLLAVKFNIPINKAFRSYPAASHDWNDLRARWVNFIVVRGSFSIGAMLLLLGSFLVIR